MNNLTKYSAHRYSNQVVQGLRLVTINHILGHVQFSDGKQSNRSGTIKPASQSWPDNNFKSKENPKISRNSKRDGQTWIQWIQSMWHMCVLCVIPLENGVLFPEYFQSVSIIFPCHIAILWNWTKLCKLDILFLQYCLQYFQNTSILWKRSNYFQYIVVIFIICTWEFYWNDMPLAWVTREIRHSVPGCTVVWIWPKTKLLFIW